MVDAPTYSLPPFAPEAPRDCPRCPRLVTFREKAAQAEPTWFNGAVPSFGASTARLLIVGLAPGLRGANRTGRPFTGDYAGELLYSTLLAFGFGTLGLTEVVSFAVWNNHRSVAVMRRIGMRADPASDFDHPDIPETHPELRRHVMYRLAREDWQARVTGSTK